MRKNGRIIMTTGAALLCVAAASAPATQEASPKLVLAGMLRSVLSGDQPSTMAALVFGNADSRASAEALLGQLLATERLRRAIVQQFDARGQDSVVGKKEEDNTKDILSRLGVAPVHVTSDGAEIALDNGQTFYLVQHDGEWKVDFDKSEQQMGGMPSKDALDAAKKQTAAIDSLTGAVVSRRAASLEEVEARYNAIMAPPPAATAPAPATRP